MKVNKQVQEQSGDRLRMKIRDLGFNQNEFARSIGISAQTITAYVTNKLDMNKMKPETLRKIANALNTSVAYLTMRSDDDIPERFATWISDSDSESEVASRMNYRNAHVKGLMKSMNVRFSKTITVNGKEYYSNYKDIFLDEYGDEVDRDDLLEQIRDNSANSKCMTEVSFHGETKIMSEEQLNKWLGSFWNSFNSILQASFGICEPEQPMISDNDITRALKGLPPLE